jgi:hypothetical protein
LARHYPKNIRRSNFPASFFITIVFSKKQQLNSILTFLSMKSLYILIIIIICMYYFLLHMYVCYLILCCEGINVTVKTTCLFTYYTVPPLIFRCCFHLDKINLFIVISLSVCYVLFDDIVCKFNLCILLKLFVVMISGIHITVLSNIFFLKKEIFYHTTTQTNFLKVGSRSPKHLGKSMRKYL